MSPGVSLHIVTVLGILIFKLAVLVVGFLITRMGFNLLVKGVTGEFKFKSSIGGARADLISASPGLLFLLLGVALLAIAVVTEKPFETTLPLDRGSFSSMAGTEGPEVPEAGEVVPDEEKPRIREEVPGGG